MAMTLSIAAKRRQKSALEDDAADRRLQIESDQRNFARHRLAMRDDLVFGSRFHRGQAEQPGMIADAARDLRFRDSLLRRPGEAGDQRQRSLVVQAAAVSAASSSTGRYRPTSRIANCVV